MEDDPETVVVFTQGELLTRARRAQHALQAGAAARASEGSCVSAATHSVISRTALPSTRMGTRPRRSGFFRRLTAKSVSAIKKAAHLLQDVEYDAVIDDAESERNPSPMAARAGATDLGAASSSGGASRVLRGAGGATCDGAVPSGGVGLRAACKSAAHPNHSRSQCAEKSLPKSPVEQGELEGCALVEEVAVVAVAAVTSRRVRLRHDVGAIKRRERAFGFGEVEAPSLLASKAAKSSFG